MLVPVFVIALIVLVVFLDMRRREAEKRLQELSLQLGQVDNQQNREKAKEIVARVRKHIDLSSDTEPTVATIVDVKKLQQKNPFYNKAKNGDYLIITTTRAVLYAPDKDLILDVVPVQIEQQAAAGTTASKAATVKPAPAKTTGTAPTR